MRAQCHRTVTLSMRGPSEMLQPLSASVAKRWSGPKPTWPPPRRNPMPLSVSMPVAGQVHSGRRVSSYLWGLLPDDYRVLARWATAHQCSATDVFALIRAVGAAVAGAARYLEPGTEPADTGSAGFDELSGTQVRFAPLYDITSSAAYGHPRSSGWLRRSPMRTVRRSSGGGTGNVSQRAPTSMPTGC